MVFTRVVLSGVFWLLIAGDSPAAGATLQAGYYTNVHVVVSASVTGTGQCIDAVGSSWISASYYPGASKTGFTDWRPYSGVSGQGEVVAAFPMTPPANQATWTGSYTTTFQPGGSPVSATFSSTTAYADAHSSVSTATFVYPVAGGGTCTTVIRSNLLPNGK